MPKIEEHAKNIPRLRKGDELPKVISATSISFCVVHVQVCFRCFFIYNHIFILPDRVAAQQSIFVLPVDLWE